MAGTSKPSVRGRKAQGFHMSVFKPKKKVVAEETDSSLPPFRIDVNGFLMFKDIDLGGCGVFEVTPAVWSAAWSHIDDYRSGDMIDDNEMIASSGVQYADARRVIVPVWVAFLNSLLPKDSNTSQTHIQILGKKTRTDNDPDYSWRTFDDYLFSMAAKDINERKDYIMGNDALRLRALDYFKMLGNYSIKSNQRSAVFDIGHATSYVTKWYIIVSYTPSSEGWWYDGRDSDYYMVEDALDLAHPLSMFSDPRFVDRLTARIMKRRNRKKAPETNTADDIFPLATDLTASVIQTRMRAIESTYDRLARNLARSKTPAAMPFTIRRLSGRELAATIAFFEDVTTPYYEKAITQLQTNTNEVFMGMDANMAIMSRDISYVDRYDEDILKGTADLQTSDAEDEEFKSRFANATQAVFSEDDAYGDEEGDDSVFDDMGFDTKSDVKQMWSGMGMSTDEFGKSDSEMFLERYGRRRVNMSYQKQQDEIKAKIQKQNEGNDDSDDSWDDIDSFMGR